MNHRYNRRALLATALPLGALALTPVVAPGSRAVAATNATPAAAAAPPRLAKMKVLEPGAAWLVAQQDASGGYLSSQGTVRGATTAGVLRALVALRATGVAVELDPAIDAALASIQSDPPEAGQEVEVILGLVAAGGDPRDVGGADLVRTMTSTWDEATSTYNTSQAFNALIILTVATAGEKVPAKAIDALLASQLDDGSWAQDALSDAGDLVATSFAIQALAATGRRDTPAIGSGLDFLRSIQNEDGGFSYSPGAPPDSNSALLIIMCLNAAGEDARADTWRGVSAALIRFQNESGAFRYSDDDPRDDLISTAGALQALSGFTYAGPPSA